MVVRRRIIRKLAGDPVKGQLLPNSAKIGGVVALALAAFLVWGQPARADDPDFIAVALGAYDINDNKTAAEGRLEYRSDKRFGPFKPLSGLLLTSDRAAYGYLGVLIDIHFGRRLVLTPSFAPGVYHRGQGKDLGHWIEFRSQLELAYRFDDRSRLGVSLSHISNASLDDNNPGTESLMLNYAVPFHRLLAQ
ncbi:MAG: deacylase [Rhodospirillaceae bacterium]|jgi:hypothetical protein|nr:deacylase [Rhodospirillaceae bacterium]